MLVGGSSVGRLRADHSGLLGHGPDMCCWIARRCLLVNVGLSNSRNEHRAWFGQVGEGVGLDPLRSDEPDKRSPDT